MDVMEVLVAAAVIHPFIAAADVALTQAVFSPRSPERGIWFGPSHEVRDRLAVAPSSSCDGSSS